MKQALKTLKNEGQRPTVKEVDVLEYMAFSAYIRNDMRSALKLTKDVLALDPEHPRARGNLNYYQGALKEEEDPPKRKQKKGEDGFQEQSEEIVTISEQKSDHFHLFDERNAYEKLCRGENGMTER